MSPRLPTKWWCKCSLRKAETPPLPFSWRPTTIHKYSINKIHVCSLTPLSPSNGLFTASFDVDANRGDCHCIPLQELKILFQHPWCWTLDIVLKIHNNIWPLWWTGGTAMIRCFTLLLTKLEIFWQIWAMAQNIQRRIWRNFKNFVPKKDSAYTNSWNLLIAPPPFKYSRSILWTETFLSTPSICQLEMDADMPSYEQGLTIISIDVHSFSIRSVVISLLILANNHFTECWAWFLMSASKHHYAQ